MSARVEIEGLAELIEELRNLPQELTSEASSIAEKAGRAAFNQISANYASHVHTGDLVGHMKMDIERSQFGVLVTVSNTAKIAFVYENGSEARHYYTKNGVKHVTGRMPALHAFIPPASRNRRAMYQALGEMVEKKGLTVTDAAT